MLPVAASHQHDEFQRWFWQMQRARTVPRFQERLARAKSTFSSFPDAVARLDFLDSYRHKWVQAYTHRAFNGDSSATTRAESMNNTLKSVARAQSLAQFLERTLQTQEIQLARLEMGLDREAAARPTARPVDGVFSPFTKFVCDTVFSIFIWIIVFVYFIMILFPTLLF